MTDLPALSRDDNPPTSGLTPIARRTPTAALRYLIEIGKDLEGDLRPSESSQITGGANRPTLTPKEAQQRLNGLLLGMEVLADRLTDDEGFAAACEAALKVLTPVERTALEPRCREAASILRKARQL